MPLNMNWLTILDEHWILLCSNIPICRSELFARVGVYVTFDSCSVILWRCLLYERYNNVVHASKWSYCAWQTTRTHISYFFISQYLDTRPTSPWKCAITIGYVRKCQYNHVYVENRRVPGSNHVSGCQGYVLVHMTRYPKFWSTHAAFRISTITNMAVSF